MLIQVIRSDKKRDFVHESVLEGLIAAHEIVKFKRGKKWVTIGVEPLRKGKQESASKNNDGTVADNSSFEREYRNAYESSLEPF
jgi:hypothetical protein